MNTMSRSLSVATLMCSLALAGCLGGGPLAAAFTVTTTDNVTFTFDASSSTGDIADYIWDFGDGNLGQGPIVEHTYEYINGDYDVTLELVASDGAIDQIVQTVTTGDQPNQAPMLLMTVDARWVRPGDLVTFDASASHDMDGDPVTLQWDMNYAIQEFETEQWVNMGALQYQSADPHAGHGEDGGDDNATGRAAWDPVALAKRTIQIPPQETKPQHGGSESGYEPPSNPDYDGSINQSTPLMTYSWPQEGEYYVRLDVTDIKGDSTTGFLAMKVTNNAPSATNVTVTNGTISYSGPALQEDGDLTNKWKERYRLDYPTHYIVDVTVDAADVGEAPLMLYLCGAQFSDAGCQDTPLVEDGPSGSSLHGEFQHSSPDAKDFKTLVVAESETPSAANIGFTVVSTAHYDLNPWYTLEGVSGGGHAGH